MTNEVGRSLFSKAGELGAPVAILTINEGKRCIPLQYVSAVTIGV